MAIDDEPRVNRALLVAAFVLACLIAAGAPFIGQARTAVRAAFPRAFSLIVGGVVAALLGAMVVAALVRIRDRRFGRYVALGAALLLGAAFSRVLRTGNIEVDVVETFHFVEYGCLTLLFYLACRPFDDGSVFVLPVVASLLVAILDEWFQWFVPLRVGELRDVLLDGAAVGCGLLFSLGVQPPARFSLALRPGSLRRVSVAVGLASLAFGGFFQTVHLGHTVEDLAADTFRSRYSREELEAADRDRSERWRDQPPLVQRPFSREDQYLSEALWHAERRNRAWGSGDLFVAWRENVILETFFAPVLDNPTYASRTGLRWPPEQRADAARRTARMVGPYESDAEPYPIYTWRVSFFWTGLIAVAAAGLLGLAVAHDEPPL